MVDLDKIRKSVGMIGESDEIIEVLTLISILVIFTMLKLESLFLILSFVFSIILINISEQR